MTTPLDEGEGRFMLWHGAPGSGKTFAIRALGWAMRRTRRIRSSHGSRDGSTI